MIQNEDKRNKTKTTQKTKKMRETNRIKKTLVVPGVRVLLHISDYNYMHHSNKNKMKK
jgi:hypothetical protein